MPETGPCGSLQASGWLTTGCWRPRAAAVRAAIPGLETVERTFCFQTLSDASALAEALRPESRVLILGAGLTASNAPRASAGLCAQIAIADLAPRVLPAVLDDTAAAMVQARMEEKGVRFYLNDSAAAFRGNTARLQSGTELEFDVLVTAVGVRPNTQLVADAGGAVDRGILVDGRCATTLPDVYAAGDCAQGYDAVSGEKRMLPLWPNAMLQGETAASTWRRPRRLHAGHCPQRFGRVRPAHDYGGQL